MTSLVETIKRTSIPAASLQKIQPLGITSGREYALDGSIITYFLFTQNEKISGDATVDLPYGSKVSDLLEFYPINGIGIPRGTRLGTRAFVSLCDEYALKHSYDHLLNWSVPSQSAKNLLGHSGMNIPHHILSLGDWKKYALKFIEASPHA